MTDKSLEQQLEDAQHRLEAARIQARNLSAKNKAAGGGGDPGVLSGIRRKKNAKADARRFAAYDREAAAWAALPSLETSVTILENRIAERDRVRYDREDIVGALFILTRWGWKKVRTVNKVTVSVESGYSWADKVAFDQVLQVKR